MDKYEKQLKEAFGGVDVKATGSIHDPHKRDFYEVFFGVGSITFIKRTNLDTDHSSWQTPVERQIEYATLEEAIQVTAEEMKKRNERFIRRLQHELVSFDKIVSEKE